MNLSLATNKTIDGGSGRNLPLVEVIANFGGVTWQK
jgi:hypothetical protein